MLTSIIIDDETNSRKSLLQKLSACCPEIAVIADCGDVEEALESIEKLKPDIVFLDIEMPRMNGFTVLNQLNDIDFEVIFVTAYDRYAIEAIRYSALDYLLKPVQVDELKNAVVRAVDKRSLLKSNARLELLLDNMTYEKTKFRRIAIPTPSGLQFVQIADIMYVEACQSYARFYLCNEVNLMVCKTLKEYEDILPNDLFIRVHHSFLVNKTYIEKYIRGEGGQAVLLNKKMLDISKRKKTDFLRAMGY